MLNTQLTFACNAQMNEKGEGKRTQLLNKWINVLDIM